MGPAGMLLKLVLASSLVWQCACERDSQQGRAMLLPRKRSSAREDRSAQHTVHPEPIGASADASASALSNKEAGENSGAGKRGSEARVSGKSSNSSSAASPRASFADYARNLTGGVPKYELVIARLEEDVDWVARIPTFWHVTVYNKGGPGRPLRDVDGHPMTVINILNHGREGETYMHHILLRWDSLAEYTVFGQANPFVHSAHYIELLNSAQLLRAVQCMSLVYTAEGHPDNVTPREVVEAHRRHPWYRSERLSLRTLDSIYFNDVGATSIGRRYLAMHALPPGTNIIAHHFDVIGLKGWVGHEQEVGSFAYGGLFGVHRDRIRQHPRHVYEAFMASLIASDLHAWIAERMYLMLFGGPLYSDA